MKPINLIKSLPLLTTFILIIILNVSNQKEYTKLKVLIWDTPKVSLGKPCIKKALLTIDGNLLKTSPASKKVSTVPGFLISLNISLSIFVMPSLASTKKRIWLDSLIES